MTKTQRSVFIAIIIAVLGFSAGAASASPCHQKSYPTTTTIQPTTTTTIKPAEATKPCHHAVSTSVTSTTLSTTSTSVIKSTVAVTVPSGSTAGTAGTTKIRTALPSGTDAIGVAHDDSIGHLPTTTTMAPQIGSATVITQPAASHIALAVTGIRTDLEVLCAVLAVALGSIFLLAAYQVRTRKP